MSDRLYIWVTGWEKFQGRRDRPGLPWFRVYSDLFKNDDFLELSSANRVLLLGIYSDTNQQGVGRVSGNLAALRSRHNVRRASLEPLIEAGFITLSGTKGAPNGHQLGAIEERSTTYSLRREENAREDAAENGVPQRSEEDMVKQLERAIASGYRPGFLDTPEGRERWERNREF